MECLQKLGCKNQLRNFSKTFVLMRHKPKPVRDPSKRQFTGEKLVERLKKKEADIQAQKPYKDAVAAVVARFQRELAEEERIKNDILGEFAKREMEEREKVLNNMAIVAKSNEELRIKREADKKAKEEEKNLLEEQDKLKETLKQKELYHKNRDIVLRLIEESKTFVNPENLDDKITFALENETYYNYAITPFGEKIISQKPPGNLGVWKGPSPTAYIIGGIKPGSAEWKSAFENTERTS
ncbi:uncharacterized protein LOC100199075 isoform X2 [Hydra vulgaris]|uniref:Small ribosomal subunit protein mS26 n=1 Tax=Hydra vulgaris TaxID=6087 RepID=A0ABM4BGX3_HYDVU